MRVSAPDEDVSSIPKLNRFHAKYGSTGKAANALESAALGHPFFHPCRARTHKRKTNKKGPKSSRASVTHPPTIPKNQCPPIGFPSSTRSASMKKKAKRSNASELSNPLSVS